MHLLRCHDVIFAWYDFCRVTLLWKLTFTESSQQKILIFLSNQHEIWCLPFNLYSVKVIETYKLVLNCSSHDMTNLQINWRHHFLTIFTNGRGRFIWKINHINWNIPLIVCTSLLAQNEMRKSAGYIFIEKCCRMMGFFYGKRVKESD